MAWVTWVARIQHSLLPTCERTAQTLLYMRLRHDAYVTMPLIECKIVVSYIENVSDDSSLPQTNK